MEGVFKPFKNSHVTGNGYQLADTLQPLPTTTNPDRLHAFYRSSNFQSIKGDVEYQIIYGKSAGFNLPSAEGKAWVEVFVAYWKAIGELLKAEEATRMNSAVRKITPVTFCIPFFCHRWDTNAANLHAARSVLRWSQPHVGFCSPISSSPSFPPTLF